MKHFQTEEWSDLARGVATSEAVAAMQQHLRAGCKSCQEMLEWCKTMAEVLKRETGYEPPEHAVRSAKALSALIEPRKRSLAALMFDSFRQPAMAGVRAASAPARQFVFESGDVVVDLKLDSIPGSDLIHILGQVMQKHDPYGIGYVPVALRKGTQQLAKTFANRFGEFQFEARIGAELNLVVVLPESRLVEVPLGTLEDRKGT